MSKGGRKGVVIAGIPIFRAGGSKAACFLAAIACLFASVLAAPARTGEPRGSVEWVAGYVEGVGSGTAVPSGTRPVDRLNAVRAAEVMAQRALAETIHGVRVDGATRMSDAVKRYVLESRVQGLVRGARKVKEEVIWDGNTPLATVTLRVCLVQDIPECRGAVTLMGILPVEQRQEPAFVPAVYYEPGPGDGSRSPAAARKPEREVAYDSSRPATGLVLDIGTMRHERELFPVVATVGEKEGLETVYSAKKVRPEIIRTHGVARYADSVEEAKKNPRLGDNPLVVPVAEVTRENLLVVWTSGARAIRETTRYGNDYLADAKVIVAGR
jgi:hypothetical protein